MLVDGPRHLRARSECHDDENRERRDMSEMVAQELVRGLIRPMPVFQLQDRGDVDWRCAGSAPTEPARVSGRGRAHARLPARHARYWKAPEDDTGPAACRSIELELLAGREDFRDTLVGARTRLELQELTCQVDPRTIGSVDADRRAAPRQHGDVVARATPRRNSCTRRLLPRPACAEIATICPCPARARSRHCPR